jgi:polar amino acid transport system substrate-binding protein
MPYLRPLNIRGVMFFVCLVFFQPAQAHTGKRIKISTVSYPPFIYENKVPSLGFGLGRDIVTEAFEAVALPTDFYIFPMIRNVRSIAREQSTANLGVFRWFQAQGMSEQVDHVDILNMHFVFFYKKARFPHGISFEQLSDLSPYVIGNVRGSATSQLIEKATLDVSFATQVAQNFKKLEAGRIDLAIAVDLAGWQIIHDLYPGEMNTFATIEKTIMTEPLALIFRKEDHDLRDAFVQGLYHLVSSRRYMEILHQYYGQQVRIERQDIPHSLLLPMHNEDPEPCAESCPKMARSSSGQSGEMLLTPQVKR